MIAEASSHVAAAKGLLTKIQAAIITPLILLLLGVALMVFLWGVFQMVMSAEDPEARTTGRRHMIYGIIGMVVMVSAFAILNIATSTFGINIEQYRP